MTSSGNPQPRELDSIVLDSALLDSALMDSPMNASELVSAERADQLVDRHYVAVYRQAYRLSGCVATAEDITQETFVQAIRHLDQLRSSEAERGWLLAIARRQFLRVLRKLVHSKHGRMVSLDNPNINAESALCEDHGESPSTSHPLPRPLQAIEDQDSVEQALSQLGQDARLIIVMHYFEELSYAEIAAQLEIPIGTVMSRLSRSREQLRKLLDDTSRVPNKKACQPSPLASPHSACPNLVQEARHG